jgi:hypothetical protein
VRTVVVLPVPPFCERTAMVSAIVGPILRVPAPPRTAGGAGYVKQAQAPVPTRPDVSLPAPLRERSTTMNPSR